MNRKIIWLVILCFIGACTEEEDTAPKKPTDYNFELISGNNQEGYYRYPLSDPIEFTVNEKISKIRFKVIQGNGAIYDEIIFGGPGKRTNSFLLGCTENNAIRAYFYYSKDEILVDSMDIYAKAKPHPNWNRSCGTSIYRNLGMFGFAAVDGIKKFSSEIFYAISDKLYRSNDAGKSWEPVNSFPHLDNINGIHSLEITPNGKILVGTRDNGIIISSDNGLTWNYSNSGLTHTYYLSKIFAINNNLIFTKSYGNGSFRSMDGGNTWQLIKTGEEISAAGEIKSIIELDGKLFLLNNDGVIKQSDNNGNSWQFLKRHDNLSAMAKDDNGNIYISAGRCEEKAILKSSDLGKTWSHFVALPDNSESAFTCFFPLEMKIQGNNLFFTDGGKLYKVDARGNLSTLNNENNMVRANHFLLLANNKIILGSDGLYYN